MEFIRYLSEDSCTNLKKETLHTKHLLPDIEKGIIFPAIRNKEISFYYFGGNLFKYNGNNFSTHHKYCFVPENIKNDYVTEKELSEILIVESFSAGYLKIKEQCKRYSGFEAQGVSELYKFSPFSSHSQDTTVLLDIEVAFNTKKEEDAGGRIDLLFYDTAARQLIFCEAKLYSNGEVRASAGQSPPVVEQLKRYDKEIKTREKEILKQYSFYVECLNQLFQTKLQPPLSILPTCGLFLFGYDTPQVGTAKELCRVIKSYGCKTRHIGRVSSIKNLSSITSNFKS